MLILGGTKEANAIAERLARDHPDWRVITSLAGRTAEPARPSGEIRVGGFGGAEGLAVYLRREAVSRLIDATHPFAREISANARRAAELAGVPLEIVDRPSWPRLPGDDWTEVASLAEACDAIPAGARVLLAIGSQHVPAFAARADVHFVVRMVDRPTRTLPVPDYELVIGKPGPVAGEKALLAEHRITHVVCRNSGGAASYAKIEAAREMGLSVIMVGR